MKTKKIETLPSCNFCKNDAVYDAPTVHGSKWAYMCKDCMCVHGGANALVVGFKFEQRTPAEPKKDSEILMGEDGDLEEAMFGDRYVTCPECGDERHVEPDAGYVYTCDGCGSKVKCPQLM